MTEQTFRALPRAVTLAAAFLIGAALFGFGAAVPAISTGARAGFVAVALLFFVVAVRCALMRIVTGPQGLKLHGPLFNLSFPWADIQAITADETEIDARTFGVRTPVIVLTNGRRVKAQPVSSFSLSGNHDTEADRIARDLERLRQLAASA